MIEQLVQEAVRAGPAQRGRPRVTADDWWIRVESDRPYPPQGWKLHVSATVASAEAVLRSVLPILVSRSARFKVAASVVRLRQLNANSELLAQAGKFLTVYPVNDAEAVDLAIRLDAATHGLRGPAIRSDRAFRDGSLVHYRYGSFRERYMLTSVGELRLAIQAPDGGLEPDRRAARYQVPGWVQDPFVAADTAEDKDAEPLAGGRYRLGTVLHESPRGLVTFATDMTTGHPCVLKTAFRDALAEDDGSDARDRLRDEAALLRSLGRLESSGPASAIPRVRDLFDRQGDLYLVLDYVPGLTIRQRIHQLTAEGRLPSDHQVMAWGTALTSLAAAMHGKGVIHRDLTASNVIEGPRGDLCLVDFELAAAASRGRAPYGRGTPGYMSPQQTAGCAPQVTDDVYAVGAILYFAVTGRDPVYAPQPGNLLAQPCAPGLAHAPGRGMRQRIADVAARALATDPAARFSSMGAMQAALSRAAQTTDAAKVAVSPEPRIDGHGEDLARLRSAVVTAPDSLHDAALGDLVVRTCGRPVVSVPLSLDTGLAGVVLGLSAATSALDRAGDREALRSAALALAHAPGVSGTQVPGLYTGEAGIASALLSAGLVLRDNSLISRAEELGRAIAAAPQAAPDLFTGAAGRLRFHLWLWTATSGADHLRAAIAAGGWLLENEQCGHWRGPASHGHMPGRPFLGYARGAAGIADALLDLYEATGDDRFLGTALTTARMLMTSADRCLDGDPSVHWRVWEGGAFFGPFWCHGAVGIGSFLLHAASHADLPGLQDTMAGTAVSAARAQWAGPGQCHGLAGNLEFLLDVWRQTRDPVHLERARELSDLLLPFVVPEIPMESQTSLSGDYMFGLAGVLVALMRLAHPDGPRQLAGNGLCSPYWQGNGCR